MTGAWLARGGGHVARDHVRAPAREAVPCGGPQLRATCLSEELFAAAAMEAVQKDLMAMKVAELKEELEARGEVKTGAKAWLRRRLHAAILRTHLDSAPGWRLE